MPQINSLFCMLLKSWCFMTVIEKSLRHRVRGSSKVQERVHCEGKTDRNGKPWTVSMLALHPGNLPLFSNLSCWIAYHLSVNLPAVRSIFAYLCFHLFKLVFTVWSSGDQRRARCGWLGILSEACRGSLFGQDPSAQFNAASTTPLGFCIFESAFSHHLQPLCLL